MKTSRDAHPLLKTISDTFFSPSSSLAVFVRSSVTASRRSRFSRTTISDLAQKSGKIRPKLRVFCFSSENFGTILSRRSRISRTSRAPSRLIRPRPIDCDRRSEQTLKIFPVLGFEHRQKRVYVSDPLSSDDLHTPNDAYICSRIFVTGGSAFARQMGYKKNAFLGAASLYYIFIYVNIDIEYI